MRSKRWDLILLFADVAELAEDPLPLAEDQLQGDLARVLGCILAHRSPVWPLDH